MHKPWCIPGELASFRTGFYAALESRSDALFELSDAILTRGTVPSPAHPSLAPAHRRGWGSLYAALSNGSVNAEALRDLLVRYPLVAGECSSSLRVYAVD